MFPLLFEGAVEKDLTMNVRVQIRQCYDERPNVLNLHCREKANDWQPET